MRNRIVKLLATAGAVVGFAMAVFGQEVPPGPPPDGDNRPRANLFRELELTPEQIESIKSYNQENRPAIQAAQKRLRDANRELDKAIYADKVEDAVVDQRLREFQEAQSEAARLRFNSELAIRKILTSEQLVRFRELRQRFARGRDGLIPGPRDGNPPMRRMNRRPAPPGI